MQRFRTLALAAIAAALILGNAGGASGQTEPLIRVGAAPDDQARPLLYGVQAGLFKKVGLNVEIVKLANGSAVAAAVAGGALEMGKGSSLTAVAAHARGLPFTVLANLANYSSDAPDTALLVLAKSALKTPRDIIGKTIGVVGLQDLNSLTVYAWLDQNGIDPGQVKFVEMPYVAAVAAMEQGRIDATMALEPAYSSAVSSGKARALAHPWSAIAKRFSNAVLFADGKWAADHRDTIDRFNRALHDAAVYVAAHEAETMPLTAQFGGFDLATLQKFHPPTRALTLDPSDLQPTIDAAAKYKLIAKPFPAQEMICECVLKAR